METMKIVLTSDFARHLGVLVTLLSPAILWYYWCIHRPYAKFPSFRVEPRLPLWILSGKNLNNLMFQKIIEIAKRYESQGVFAGWIGVPYLIVYGKDIVKLIVNEPETINKPKLYELLEVALGKGLLTSNGETFRKQKKLLNPAFHVVALKEHTSIMNENADNLVKRLSELKGQPSDELVPILFEYSLRIVCESAMGRTFDKGDRRLIEIIQKGAEFIIYRLWCPWLYFNFALKLFPSSRKALKLIEEGMAITVQAMEEEKELLTAQETPLKFGKSDEDSKFYGRKPKSISNILLEQHLKDSSFSFREICDQINLLATAGSDTTSHALMWTLFLLGLHQDVQERAHDEIEAETDGDVQFKDLNNLTYLECVIKETQRIYPTAPIFGRRLSKDIQSDRYLIPKNTTVFILSYMLHRNPDIYPDPEKFDPERFMAKDSKIKSWHFIPFAEGTRSCIGKNFAMMEMKIVLSHILRNFKVISLDRREDVEFSWAIVMGSTKKLRMQFLPRY